MRLGIAALAIIAGIIPAIADDVTIQVNEQWKPILLNAQGMVDQCVGSAQVRSDFAKCRELSNFLGQLASLPTTPVPRPAPATPAPQQESTDAPKN